MRKMVAVLFLGLTPLLCPMTVVAATPEELLHGAWQDPRVKLHQEATTIVVDAKSKNFLNKMELRLDRGRLNVDEFEYLGNFSEQKDVKYSLRFYPKGLGEVRTTTEFQKALEQSEKIASAQALSQILSVRYDLLARIALLKEKRTMADELAKVSGKGTKALSYSAQKDRAELKSYLKDKSDLDKLNIKIADIQRDYENLQVELADLSLGRIESFDLSDFASMEDLQQRLEKAADDKPIKTLSAQSAELDLKAQRAGMNYERAKDEKWFDHLEVSVDANNRYERTYSFELAFNLPFASAPDLSRIEKEARDLRDKAELIETLQTSERAFKNSLIELKTLLAVHKSMATSQSQMNLAQMRKASGAISRQDPMLALQLQRGWYEGREQLLDLEFRIRTLFILYLHESSTIANSPETNYLSKSLKRIF